MTSQPRINMNNHEFKYSGERSPWRSEFPLQKIRVDSCAFVVTSERLAAPRSGFSGTTEPTCSSLNLHPFAAFSKAAMSILSISIIAFMTRFAFPVSGSANISPKDRVDLGDFPRRFSARAQVRAVLVTSAPSILAFACLFAFGAANLRGEQQKTGSA